MHIRIFVTGGTFDKEYDEINGNLYFKKTHIREMLDLGRSKIDVNISTLMMKDSLEMNIEDRLLILDNCLKAKEDKIIITHGTDTMVKTAKSIASKKLGISKTEAAGFSKLMFATSGASLETSKNLMAGIKSLSDASGVKFSKVMESGR